MTGTRLARKGEARVGRWSRGLVFGRDGRTILVGNMAAGEKRAKPS